MSEITDRVREFVSEKCEKHKENPKYGFYDYWNDHIKRVVHHAVKLAKQCGADEEIVELGALLHDVSMPSEYGDRSEHHVYSAEMTKSLLTELHYPKDRIERVRNCVFNHSGRNAHLRCTAEEICIADADALAHFDRIPSLFKLAYCILNMNLEDGTDYVKKRLRDDYNGLSKGVKEEYRTKFEMLTEALFVD